MISGLIDRIVEENQAITSVIDSWIELLLKSKNSKHSEYIHIFCFSLVCS